MKIALTLLLFIVPLQAAAEPLLPAAIDVVETGAGRLFVNKDGLTLYTYTQDLGQPGTSACVDDCAEQWPPEFADENSVPIGDWSVIRRQDGTHQWAHKERPVYRNAKDTQPGAIIGEKAFAYWEVLFEPIQTPPGIYVTASRQGQVLVDLSNRQIFTNVSDTCGDRCLEDWRRLEAPWLANINDPVWTITRLENDFMQWTYSGHLLFTYEGDEPIETAIDARADQGWQAVILQDAPEIPSWVDFQESDFGLVMANSNRMTLYYIVSDADQIASQTCDKTCEQENWSPVFADESAIPVGNWSMLGLEDGSRQWTYLGLRVFTYKHDIMPGDTRGNKFGAGAGVRGGWMAIPADTLIQLLN